MKMHFGQPSWSNRWRWIYIQCEWTKRFQHGGWLYLSPSWLWRFRNGKGAASYNSTLPPVR